MKFVLKIICLLLVTTAIALIVMYYNPKQQVKIADLTKRMSEQDKIRLSLFFEDLVCNHCFGYTLFGDKPISSTTYFVRPLIHDLLFEEKSGIILRNGEKAWMSHKNSFVLKKFLIKLCTYQNIRYIYLINKSLFTKQVETHIEYFKQTLGPDIDAKELLNRLEQENLRVEELLQNHHGLIGILYGFGKQNAMNFQRYSELDAPLYDDPLPPYKVQYEEDFLALNPEQKLFLWINRKTENKNRKKQKLVPSRGFQDLRQEYNHMQSKLDYTHEAFALQRFSPPGFRMDPDSQETKELLASYKKSRLALSEIYTNGNFLEITLTKLTEE